MYDVKRSILDKSSRGYPLATSLNNITQLGISSSAGWIRFTDESA
jgi:hypothetical protein